MITIPAKCILSGEHTVLEGGYALVAPLNVFNMKSSYMSMPHDTFLITINGQPLDNEICNKIIEFDVFPKNLFGSFNIFSDIPQGAGLGSSAALCVSIVKLLVQEGYLSQNELVKIATYLEDLFHGKSSGVDIIGVLATGPTLYRREKSPTLIDIKWKPLLYLSYTGSPSQTKIAVENVLKFKNTSEGRNIFEDMNAATALITKALNNENQATNLIDLCNGINLASTCFERWKLNTDKVKLHQEFLKRHGAIATKPTGSGGEGYILSLWEQEPSKELNLIRLKL